MIGCASHKQTNRLASKIDCDRDFYFAYDERSDFEDFNYTGEHFGDSKFPDFKQTFIKSINELNNDTEMQLEFVESDMLPSNNSTFARVRIEEIRWNWGLTNAVMEVDLQYEMESQKIYLTGKNKLHMGGTKKGSLYKALKNGHFLFISSICSPR